MVTPKEVARVCPGPLAVPVAELCWLISTNWAASMSRMSPPSWVPVKGRAIASSLPSARCRTLRNWMAVVRARDDRRPGHVAVGPVIELRPGAVGVAGVQADLAAVLGVPAREHGLAVGEHRGREVVIGVEADLMHARAVGVHDMQQEDRLLLVVGDGLVLRPAFIEEDGLRRELARRGEHDASVGEEMGADVMTCGDVIVRQLRDRLGGGVILIDMPVGLLGVIVVERWLSGMRSEKIDLPAIRRDIEVAHRALSIGDREGDVDLGRSRRSPCRGRRDRSR